MSMSGTTTKEWIQKLETEAKRTTRTVANHFKYRVRNEVAGVIDLLEEAKAKITEAKELLE
jgi:hypothetical protein